MYDVERVPQLPTLKVSAQLSISLSDGWYNLWFSIQDEYEEVTGEPLFDAHTSLNTIDSVYCDVYSNDEPKWYVKSDNIQHLTKMIKEQRSASQQQQQQRQPKPQHVLNDTINSNDCFFKDNVIYKLR